MTSSKSLNLLKEWKFEPENLDLEELKIQILEHLKFRKHVQESDLMIDLITDYFDETKRECDHKES